MTTVKTRCKMKVDSITQVEENWFNYKLSPVISDGCEENKKFFKYTPGGVLELQCTNKQPIELGKEYYIDIIEAPKEQT